jgi:hypothetical protein
MARIKPPDALSASNPLFGAATQGGVASAEILPLVKGGLEPAREFRQHPVLKAKPPKPPKSPKPRMRRTTRAR